MTLRGLLGFVALGFCVLDLVVEPQLAYGSSRGPFGLSNGAMDPTTVGICASSEIMHGYKCEEHEVTTKDGYILTMLRIPEGRVGGNGTKRQPVYLQHGVTADGLTWLMNSPEQNLPTILADKGFDVWIANTRGTRFSRRHTSLDPSQRAYWNWSWDELVTYELPAIFDFVYNQTGQKIDYVGHSLGTLTALAYLSEGGPIDKIKSVALLSPIAYLSHMKTVLGVATAKAFAAEITKLLGLAEFIPKVEAVSVFLNSICAIQDVNCYDLLTEITGPNCCLNASTDELFVKFEPQPTSTKNMVHLAQTVRDGVVAKYNYGIYNFLHYGQFKPPIYNLSNIPRNVPLFLSYGGQDALSDVTDVELLLDDLKFHDRGKLNVQYVKDYAHIDFIMAVNAKDIVYNQIIKFFTSN